MAGTATAIEHSAVAFITLMYCYGEFGRRKRFAMVLLVLGDAHANAQVETRVRTHQIFYIKRISDNPTFAN